MRRIYKTVENYTEKTLLYNTSRVSSKILSSSKAKEEKLINIPSVNYVKLPVLLSNFKLNLTIDSSLKFKENNIILKRVKRNVRLLKCKVIKNTNVIFIDGIIQEDIEYVGENIDMIKHKSDLIPFNCVSNIKYNTKPIFHEKECFLERELESICADEDSQLFAITTEITDEELYCELDRDIITEIIKIKEQDEVYKKVKVIEKTLDIELFLKLYQKQLIKL